MSAELKEKLLGLAAGGFLGLLLTGGVLSVLPKAMAAELKCTDKSFQGDVVRFCDYDTKTVCYYVRSDTPTSPTISCVKF